MDLDADPPLGAGDLEGQLLLGAQYLLDKDLPLGSWAPHLLDPFHARVHALAFAVFGTRLATARAVSAVGAVLFLAGFYALLHRSRGPATALLALLLLATNHVFFAVARTSLPAILSLDLMLLTIAVWELGRTRNLAAFVAGAMVVGVGLIENGPRNLFFVGAGLLVLLLIRLHGWRMTWGHRTRTRTGMILAGGLVSLVVFTSVVLSHWQEYGNTWAHFYHGSMRTVAANVVMTPVYVSQMVRLMPVTAAAAAVAFLFFAKDALRPVTRHRRLDETRLWILAWILGGIAYYVMIAAPPLDALVLLVPPICALAAEGLTRLFSLRRLKQPQLDVGIVLLAISAVIWFLVAWGVHEVFSRIDAPGYLGRHAIRTTFALTLLLWGGLSYLSGWLYLRWKRHTLPVRSVPVSGLVVILAVIMVGVGVNETGEWWWNRTHAVRDARERLRDLPPTSLVVGSWAPLLTLGVPARSGVVWRGTNDSPAMWHGEVTHLLLQEGRELRPDSSPRRLFLPGPGTPEPLLAIPFGDTRLLLFAIP